MAFFSDRNSPSSLPSPAEVAWKTFAAGSAVAAAVAPLEVTAGTLHGQDPLGDPRETPISDDDPNREELKDTQNKLSELREAQRERQRQGGRLTTDNLTDIKEYMRRIEELAENPPTLNGTQDTNSVSGERTKQIDKLKEDIEESAAEAQQLIEQGNELDVLNLILVEKEAKEKASPEEWEEVRELISETRDKIQEGEESSEALSEIRRALVQEENNWITWVVIAGLGGLITGLSVKRDYREKE